MMETDNTNESQTTPSTEPGVTLARVREQQGMTVEQVAEKLHLSQRQIDALENNRYEELPEEDIEIIESIAGDIMDELGYGKNYKYPHESKNNFVTENYFPEDMKNKQFYFPSDNGQEKRLKERLKMFWKERKKYD